MFGAMFLQFGKNILAIKHLENLGELDYKGVGNAFSIPIILSFSDRNDLFRCYGLFVPIDGKIICHRFS